MFPRCQGACYRSVDDWVCALGFIFLHWGSSPTGWFSRSCYYVEILSWSTARCFIQNTSIRSGPGDFQSQFYLSFSWTSVIVISVKLFAGEFPRCAISSVYDSSDCSILISKIVRIILFLVLFLSSVSRLVLDLHLQVTCWISFQHLLLLSTVILLKVT